jgi:hypothetical protein
VTWQRELAARALRSAEDVPGIAAVEVAGSLADGGGRADSWSDVDLHVRLADDPAGRALDPVAWVARFGTASAVTSQPTPSGRVVRVVYDDGRRLDVVVDGGGGQPAAEPGDSADRVDLMEVRQAAALAVVRLARDDLLIGTHLALEVVQRCLVLAMVLRDRQLGTTSHRVGGPFNDVVARLDRLRRHPWTADGGMRLVRDAAGAYDELALQLDASCTADWSGLEALLRQAAR